MADIFDILINILCPTQGSASYCRDFLTASHHQILPPLGPLFYFLLFPSVFIILFIYFLSGRIISEHKGLRVLVGISAFIFVIISGWYPAALWLSEVWYIATIVLLGLWVFVGRLWKGRESSGPTSMPGFRGEKPGLLKEIKDKAVNKWVRDRIIEYAHLDSSEKRAYDKIVEKYKKSNFDMNVLTPAERAIIQMSLLYASGAAGMSVKERAELKNLLKAESSSDEDLDKAA